MEPPKFSKATTWNDNEHSNIDICSEKYSWLKNNLSRLCTMVIMSEEAIVRRHREAQNIARRAEVPRA